MIAVKHLFLTDIDGTLVRQDVPLPDRVTAAAREYTDLGGLLAVCTGRSLPAAREVALALGVNAPSILYGGAAVYDFQSQSYLYAKAFAGDVMAGVEAVLAREPEVSMQVLTQEAVYVLRRNRRLNEKGVKEENIGPECPPEAVKGPILKLVMCCDDPLRLEACRGFFPPALCNFKFASRSFVDIVPAGSGKEDALEALSRLLEIPHDRLFCAGDAMTDMPILRAAGTSFAPENAMEAVKQAVTCVVPHVAQGGMAEAFRQAAELLKQNPMEKYT